MECKFNHAEFCTNSKCPMCGDYCPIPDDEGICRYEDRDEKVWMLSPKGCFRVALTNHITLNEDIIDFIWHDFEKLMSRMGYVGEE